MRVGRGSIGGGSVVRLRAVRICPDARVVGEQAGYRHKTEPGAGVVADEECRMSVVMAGPQCMRTMAPVPPRLAARSPERTVVRGGLDRVGKALGFAAHVPDGRASTDSLWRMSDNMSLLFEAKIENFSSGQISRDDVNQLLGQVMTEERMGNTALGAFLSHLDQFHAAVGPIGIRSQSSPSTWPTRFGDGPWAAGRHAGSGRRATYSADRTPEGWLPELLVVVADGPYSR